MVKTRVSSHARINRATTKLAIKSIFGRTLTIRRTTETVDDFGQLSAFSTTDETFTGDLQFGLDLDQRYISTGVVEVGDAVLYIEPNALTNLPKPQDKIVDSSTNSIWEIMDQIEAPELGGAVVHFVYRCRRLIESSDTKQ